MRRRRFASGLSCFLILFFVARPASAQPPPNPARNLTSGEAIYQSGCAGCHGPHGEGAPDTTVGFDKPDTFPDFTDCEATSREPDVDWQSIVHDGGAARGFSRIMPAFGDLLTPQQISAVVDYLRGFCRDAAWPRGELNLPRALATEKAFPEDEAVVTVGVSHARPTDVSNLITYERRVGPRNQIEISVPLDFVHGAGGDVSGGVGDVALGFKRALYASLRTGSMLSVQGEVVTPTGNADKGLGAGTTVFEGFAAYGQLLPSDVFVQAQAGTEQPADPDVAPRAVFGRLVVGKTFREESGRGRAWSPMIELLTDREFEEGAKASVDLLPQFQVTLSRRQHLRGNFGVQLPVTNRSGRAAQFLFYVLWDWFDGGLLQGWR
jgi:mono/diheme cytochrome c family protein